MTMNVPGLPDDAAAYTLSLPQAALLARVSLKTIKRAVKSGQISCLRVSTPQGREVWLRADEVETKAAALRVPEHYGAPSASGVNGATMVELRPASDGIPPKKDRKSRRKAQSAAVAAPDEQLTPAPEPPSPQEVVAERLEGMNARLADMAAQQQELVQANLEITRRYAELSAHAEGAAAEAASYRERAAWLEGLLSEANREITELRALPAPAEPAPNELPALPAKPWWLRLLRRGG